MTTPLVAETTARTPHRFVRALSAALVVVLSYKGLEVLVAPDGLAASVWQCPFTIALQIVLASLILSRVARWNDGVLVRRWEAMRAAHWRNAKIWAAWIGYGIFILVATFYITASNGHLLWGIAALVALTFLNERFHQTAHPFRLLLQCLSFAAVIPIYLFLRPMPVIDTDAPIIWVGMRYDQLSTQSVNTKSRVYWQRGLIVFLQWNGHEYRLNGLSPAFTVWRKNIVSLEERDLVVTPTDGGTAKRIPLKPHIPNYKFIADMQPTRSGVLLNVTTPNVDHTKTYRAMRVNLTANTVRPIPNAWQVRGAESTDRYMATWSEDFNHQTRNGFDWLLRQHGWVPWHYQHRDTDPVDDLVAVARTLPDRSEVALVGRDGITGTTLTMDMRIDAITMQPGRQQIWVTGGPDNYAPLTSPSKHCIRIYTYSGRFLGERTVNSDRVIRIMPIDEATARYLVETYAVEL